LPTKRGSASVLRPAAARPQRWLLLLLHEASKCVWLLLLHEASKRLWLLLLLQLTVPRGWAALRAGTCQQTVQRPACSCSWWRPGRLPVLLLLLLLLLLLVLVLVTTTGTCCWPVDGVKALRRVGAWRRRRIQAPATTASCSTTSSWAVTGTSSSTAKQRVACSV
jgi:hypothetical protein